MTFRKERYPVDWQTIRMGILLRANNACERCRAPNRVGILRGRRTYMLFGGETFDAETGAFLGYSRDPEFEGQERAITVILTVAHLDHDESHNDPENLAALCQRCHLAHDRADNLRRRRARTAGPMLPGLGGAR